MSTLFQPLQMNQQRVETLYNSFNNIFTSIEPLYKYPTLGEALYKYPTLAETLYKYPTLADWMINYNITHFDPPKLAIDADDTKDERKWLIRADHGYTNWGDLNNIFSQTDFQYVLGGITPTNNYVSKVGNTSFSNGTLVKFFIPSVLPTGYSEWFADNITVIINGIQILSTGSYHNSRKDVSYDFSNIIKVNEFNYIAIRWYGSGSHGCDFGLLE